MKLFIMRGLPGSGKSTRAKEIAAGGAVVCSADDYFVGPDGVYRFDPSKLGDAHRACYKKAAEAMQNGEDCVLDNTNTQHWEYRPYVQVALAYGYTVEVITVGDLTSIDEYAARNTHGVPREVLVKMAARFEP